MVSMAEVQTMANQAEHKGPAQIWKCLDNPQVFWITVLRNDESGAQLYLE